MEDNPKDYTRLGIMSFYQKWCLDSDDLPKRESDDDDSYEQRIRDFLSILHKGIESQEIAVYGGDIQNIHKHIKIVEDAQRYEWGAIGDEKPQYRKIGAHNRPLLLWLQMFGLEEIKVDPVKLLDWMMEREDRRAFLAPSAKLGAPTSGQDQPIAIAAPCAPASPRRGHAKPEVTQQEAAKKLGVNVRTIRGWEKGKHTPKGYLGRASRTNFLIFAEDFKMNKALKKDARAKNRATPDGDMDEYSEDTDM